LFDGKYEASGKVPIGDCPGTRSILFSATEGCVYGG